MAADALGRHFTQIYNGALRDKRLSRRARGMLAELLTHSDGFGITVANLVTVHEGRDAVTGALKELERYGYLHRRRIVDPSTKKLGGSEYFVTDMPDGFSVSCDFGNEEKRWSETVTENPSQGKTPGGSLDTGFQELDSQELDYQALAQGPHKKTNEEKTNQKKNTLGATAPKDGAAAPGEGVQGWSPEETETRIAELCRLLVDQVKANGAKPPKITYAWKNAARDLLSGEDPYTYEQVRDGICWAQADNFWASRTTTMAKLAKHFDQIIIRARKDQQDTSTPQGKQAQQDLMTRRLEAMQKLMDLYEAKVKRPMTDSERERLKARVKEEIQ